MSSVAARAGQADTSVQPKRSLGQLISINIFWFALNFHWAALPLILIPSQVIWLLFQQAPAGTLASQAAWVNQNKGLAEAVVLAPGAIVALLGNPFFGLLSDRTPGRFGRRRPYVLGGTFVNVIGLGAMALLPAMLVGSGGGVVLSPALLALMGGLMFVQFANNAAAAPFHALLPDLVPPEQRGKASGLMGLAFWCGTICGAIVPTLFGFNSTALLDGTQSPAAYQHGVVLGYAATAGIILLMAILTCVFVRERPWQSSMTPAEERNEQRHTLRDLGLTLLALAGLVVFVLLISRSTGLTDKSLNYVQLIGLVIASIGAAFAFDFHPRRNPDFTWVLVTRMLVMMGIYIVQNFVLFYMQDVAHAPNPQSATSLFVILLTIAATVSTFFGGWLSDRIGRKRIVYLAGSFMAVVGAIFVIAPYIFGGEILTVSYIMAAIFGLGFGAYVSVDWALVADVLPSEKTFARDMGIWNIALTLPQVLAVIFGGWLLTFGHFGYTLLFVCLVIFCVLGTVTVRFIRGVK
ncbi:MAG TPA: MFS transporter [Ktedonobacterales bacterium]|nr:MFS transporter [Ktedonobacterales bacterium]